MKACWLMTNSQNPLGFTLTPQKKAQLVALLDEYNVTLIEDDVYSELYFGREKPLPAKASGSPRWRFALLFVFEMSGAWFSYWLGRRKTSRKIQRLQLMSTLSTSSPMQLALVDYLPRADTTPIFVACVASLRNVNNVPGRHCCVICLRKLKFIIVTAVIFSGWSSRAVRCRRIKPGGTDRVVLSIAPGKMFSTGENWSRFFRFNTAWQWGEREEQAVKQLGKLIQERL